MCSLNSLIRDAEKLTYSVYGFINWLNGQRIAVIFSTCKKEPYVLHSPVFQISLYWQLKNRDRVSWNISIWEKFPHINNF